MKIPNWSERHFGWLGLTLTFLVAIFPNTFAKIGVFIRFTFTNYWLQLGVFTIIILLLFVYRLLLKQQKKEP
ncbi:hypothetical protein ACFCYN_14935 [Gottfriedia sp. NPDC056225]|uniref:hypothetical protein n=1 Tax=Gottfriedia sp. NPDC056225 TaxID=3345751 RepID=UPI0035DAA0B6